MWSRVWASFVKWMSDAEGLFFFFSFYLCILRIFGCWSCTITPQLAFPTYFYQPLLIDLVFFALCKRLHSFSRCPPVQWAVCSPVTHFLSHQNYRPPLQQLDVCVGGKKKEPIPWAARNTDTNVSPRASIKLCRPFSCLPTTSIRRATPRRVETESHAGNDSVSLTQDWNDLLLITSR